MSDASSGAPLQAADQLPDSCTGQHCFRLCLLESPRYRLMQLSSALLLWLQATFARISGYVEQVLMLFLLASSAYLSRASRLLPLPLMSHESQDHQRGLVLQQELPCVCRMTFTPLEPQCMRLLNFQPKCASLMSARQTSSNLWGR